MKNIGSSKVDSEGKSPDDSSATVWRALNPDRTRVEEWGALFKRKTDTSSCLMVVDCVYQKVCLLDGQYKVKHTDGGKGNS